jgi:hypothetical protein
VTGFNLPSPFAPSPELARLMTWRLEFEDLDQICNGRGAEQALASMAPVAPQLLPLYWKIQRRHPKKTQFKFGNLYICDKNLPALSSKRCCGLQGA